MLQKLKRIPGFFKEVREELRKVNWSSRHELVAATAIVIITSCLFTLYIFAIDLGLAQAIQTVLK